MKHQNRLHYFAYGSNMSSRRLQHRLPAAEALGRASVLNHEVVFNKVGSIDGTGKCGLISTNGARAHGVLFRINETDLSRLHAIEGVGQGYEAITITADSLDGKKIEALSYRATLFDPALRPLDWYMQHVLAGAEEHGLPADYIDLLRQIEIHPDQDRQRWELETAIYA